MTAPAMTADRALAALDDILTTGTGMLPDEVEGLREARAFFADAVLDEYLARSKGGAS